MTQNKNEHIKCMKLLKWIMKLCTSLINQNWNVDLSGDDWPGIISQSRIGISNDFWSNAIDLFGKPLVDTIGFDVEACKDVPFLIVFFAFGSSAFELSTNDMVGIQDLRLAFFSRVFSNSLSFSMSFSLLFVELCWSSLIFLIIFSSYSRWIAVSKIFARCFNSFAVRLRKNQSYRNLNERLFFFKKNRFKNPKKKLMKMSK